MMEEHGVQDKTLARVVREGEEVGRCAVFTFTSRSLSAFFFFHSMQQGQQSVTTVLAHKPFSLASSDQ